MPMRPRSGRQRVVRQRKSWRSSSADGALNENTWQPCGLTPDMTCLIVPSLPAASIAWKTSNNDPSVLGIEYILLPCEPLRSALEKLRRPALSQLQAAGVVRVEILQTKALALGD